MSRSLNFRWLAQRLAALTYAEMVEFEDELKDKLLVLNAATPREGVLAKALDAWASIELEGTGND